MEELLFDTAPCNVDKWPAHSDRAFYLAKINKEQFEWEKSTENSNAPGDWGCQIQAHYVGSTSENDIHEYVTMIRLTKDLAIRALDLADLLMIFQDYMAVKFMGDPDLGPVLAKLFPDKRPGGRYTDYDGNRTLGGQLFDLAELTGADGKVHASHKKRAEILESSMHRLLEMLVQRMLWPGETSAGILNFKGLRCLGRVLVATKKKLLTARKLEGNVDEEQYAQELAQISSRPFHRDRVDMAKNLYCLLTTMTFGVVIGANLQDLDKIGAATALTEHWAKDLGLEVRDLPTIKKLGHGEKGEGERGKWDHRVDRLPKTIRAQEQQWCCEQLFDSRFYSQIYLRRHEFALESINPKYEVQVGLWTPEESEGECKDAVFWQQSVFNHHRADLELAYGGTDTEDETSTTPSIRGSIGNEPRTRGSARRPATGVATVVNEIFGPEAESAQETVVAQEDSTTVVEVDLVAAEQKKAFFHYTPFEEPEVTDAMVEKEILKMQDSAPVDEMAVKLALIEDPIDWESIQADVDVKAASYPNPAVTKYLVKVLQKKSVEELGGRPCTTALAREMMAKEEFLADHRQKIVKKLKIEYWVKKFDDVKQQLVDAREARKLTHCVAQQEAHAANLRSASANGSCVPMMVAEVRGRLRRLSSVPVSYFPFDGFTYVLFYRFYYIHNYLLFSLLS